jgi:hypothetical protein
MRYAPEPILNSDPKRIAEYLQRELYKLSDTLRNPDVVWEDLRVSLETAKPGATKVPGFEKVRDDGAGSTGVYAYHFDDSTIEEVFFEVQLPHAYKQYSPISPHIHWLPKGTGTGVVRWGLEYSFTNIGEVFPTTSIIYAENAGSGSAYMHQIGEFSTILCPDKKISSVMLCRLFRDASHGNDTYTGDAVGLTFDIHIQLDTNGSEVEYIKRVG